jgi:hypothetical protein
MDVWRILTCNSTQDDATVKCWGYNGEGQLGYGDKLDRGDGINGACPARHTPHPTPHTLHPTANTLHPTPYTLHPSPTPCTLHPTLAVVAAEMRDGVGF